MNATTESASGPDVQQRRPVAVIAFHGDSGAPAVRRIHAILSDAGMLVRFVGGSDNPLGPPFDMTHRVTRTARTPVGRAIKYAARIINLGVQATAAPAWFKDWANRRIAGLQVSGDLFECAVLVIIDLFLAPVSMAAVGRQNTAIWWHLRDHPIDTNMSNRFTQMTERPIRTRLVQQLGPEPHLVTTVSQGIASDLHERFGIEVGVLYNSAAGDADLSPRMRHDAPRIRIVHHALAEWNRKPWVIVLALRGLPQHYQSDLYFKASRGTRACLRLLAWRSSNVSVYGPLDHVPSRAYLSQYDVGVVAFPSKVPNLRWALPNKLFQYIDAGLALVGVAQTSTGDVVRELSIGEIADIYSVRALRSAVLGIDRQRLHDLQPMLEAAGRMHSAQAQKENNAALLTRLRPDWQI